MDFAAGMVPCMKQWSSDKEQALAYHPLGTQLFTNSILGNQLCVLAIQSCCLCWGSLIRASASVILVLSSSLHSLINCNKLGGLYSVPIC